MSNSFIIGAYWGSRAEPLMIVSDKVLRTLNMLAETDEQFLNWYEGGMSRKKALEKKVSIDSESIEKLCRSSVKKGELDENGFAKYGFITGLWTGHQDQETSGIQFIVGDTFKIPNIKNVCVINIPFKGAAHDRLLEVEKAKSILGILVEIWKPDYAVLISDDLRDKLHVGNQIGWITYQKSIQRYPILLRIVFPKTFDKLIYEKTPDGHWFFPKPGNTYDDDLVKALLILKKNLRINSD